MPLGWYLAQGLVPLGPSSSDDEEGPCTLPDGRVVCGPHGHELCYRCCTDYTPMNEDAREDDGVSEGDDDDYGDDFNFRVPLAMGAIVRREPLPDPNVTTRGTGRVFPTKFFPPSPTIAPLELFSGRRQHMAISRITHRNDPRKGLIFTDGACLNNGQANPKAGWAFHQGFLSSGEPALAAGRLEKKGPFDSDESEDRAQTSNRAELRAVIAVLGFRHWPGEGFESLVIATDSSYVVDGATKWAKGWVKHSWKTRNGEDVKNKDLWEALLGAVEDAKAKGFTVHLWQIPRELNTVADAAAKEAAETQEAPDKWAKIFGMAF